MPKRKKQPKTDLPDGGQLVSRVKTRGKWREIVHDVAASDKKPTGENQEGDNGQDQTNGDEE